jgi:UDPglucose 6-dehydrogenase
MADVLKIAIIGVGHLADATAAECREHFEMVTPSHADLVWFCMDMPVSDNDESDVDAVLGRLRQTLRHTLSHVPILVSTQVPVGFCARIEAEFPDHHIAIQPENIRKAHAREDFHSQNRIIVGTRHPEDHDLIYRVVSRFCPDPRGILFMSPESAEMVKHTLNAWLAMNIAFANEIADLCPQVGANTDDVFRGFRSDRRMNHQTPNKPGGPYRGGTLGRDVHTLIGVSDCPLLSAKTPLLRAIQASNAARLAGL